MIYAGMEDFICNWLGNWVWVEYLSGDGQTNFNMAELKKWASPIDGSDAGEVKSYGPCPLSRSTRPDTWSPWISQPTGSR